MGNIADYAYLNARVSIMAARLLDDDALAAMIKSSEQDLAQLFVSVSKAGINPIQSSATPVTFEQQLMSALLNEMVLLTRPLSGTCRNFLLYWGYRFELSNLKTIIRGKMNLQPADTIRKELVDMGPFARLPLEALLQTDDVMEMLRLLDGTPYAEIARQARGIFEGQHDLFHLDAALDRRYYAGLATHAWAFDGPGKIQLRELVANIIDRVNLVWLLRYRFSYNLGPAEAYYLLIPTGFSLTSSQLLALSQLGSQEEVLDRLPPSFVSLLQGVTSITDITQRLERETWRIAESVLAKTTFNPARAFAYLILRERDLRRVRAILRGRMIRLSESLIAAAAGLSTREVEAAGL